MPRCFCLKVGEGGGSDLDRVQHFPTSTHKAPRLVEISCIYFVIIYNFYIKVCLSLLEIRKLSCMWSKCVILYRLQEVSIIKFKSCLKYQISPPSDQACLQVCARKNVQKCTLCNYSPSLSTDKLHSRRIDRNRFVAKMSARNVLIQEYPFKNRAGAV